MLGVAKAYATRVGSGPFPTELDDEVGEHLRVRGNEYGSVTGRPRRCGWFDAAGLRRVVEINGISGLCITKLDVLDGLDTVRVAVGYKVRGERRDHTAGRRGRAGDLRADLRRACRAGRKARSA